MQFFHNWVSTWKVYDLRPPALDDLGLIHEILTLEIIDDGPGLTPSYKPGVGFSTMRERAEELGGSCIIECRPAGGTRVYAQLPLS